jgi:very-short-patch-repair endonuclease
MTNAEAKKHRKGCQLCQQIRKAIRKKTRSMSNQSEYMRKKASEAAKITSARPDIQQQRAERLASWRKANPEAFLEIQMKAHASPKKSKMENWLEPILEKIGFQRNMRFYCGQTRKQVDFQNKSLKVLVEVDGPWHFIPLNGDEVLQRTQMRDRILDAEILHRRKWKLVRISMENFKNSGEIDSEERLRLFEDVILGKMYAKYKIVCIGGLYESNMLENDQVMILR